MNMAKKKSLWKKSPGKLGIFTPLLGVWKAESDSPMGKLNCTRTFSTVLGGKYIQLHAIWQFANYAYEELALYGVRDGAVSFWSFTSDGKRSEGKIADGGDIHQEAICFEAKMPAGLARMVFWPREDGGFNWAVESKTKKGWNRFTEHHYRLMDR
jgi:hypothetical protein